MLRDKRLLVYEGSGADVTGSNVEGTKGGATVAMKLGGDARFLAAQALAQIGAKAKRRTDVLNALKAPDVQELLQEAAKSPDPATRSAAEEAQRFISAKK